jgi:2-acylglycerol O-acyltransferase 2
MSSTKSTSVVLIDPHVLPKSEYGRDEWDLISKPTQVSRGSCARVVPMSLMEEMLAVLLLFFVFPGPALWVPLGVIYALVCCSWNTVLIVVSVTVGLAFYPVQFHSRSVMRSYFFRLILRYFSFRVIFDSPPDGSKHGIMVTMPHGVVPIGNILMIVFAELYCGITIHGLAASAVFHVPIFRTLFLWLGVLDASRATVAKALANKQTLGVCIGGIAEIFKSRGDNETIVLKNRKGFIREAMVAGSCVRPVYLFGNTQAMTCVSDNHGILESISRKLRTTVVLFYGRFFLPIPHRTPILSAVGNIIDLPQRDSPTDAEVDAYHAQFVSAIQDLFERHKAAYGWAHKKLVVV